MSAVPIDYKKYGKLFQIISRVLRGYGKCCFCGAHNHYPHPRTGSRVVLTCHHIDGDRNNNSLDNLVPLCQACHLAMHHNRKMVDFRPTQPILFMQELKHLRDIIKSNSLEMATRGRIGYDEHEQILQWMKPKQHGSLPAQG
jgi:hypothetical protein